MNTGVIAEAIQSYGRFAEMLDVPYLVDADILAFTLPPGKEDAPLGHPNGKFYVASAEQSFLQMEKDGYEFIAGHPYMALTPCYRTEEVLDESHFNIFLKLELIEFYPSFGEVREYAEEMRYFFWTYYKVQTRIVETEIGLDVEDMNGLELGSFGTRLSPQGHPYIYATAIAEPRASMAINRRNHD